MAVNINKRQPGAKILKTPAPDEISQVRHPSQAGPGMNGPQPSSVAPGQASRSVLGQNLMESSDDGENVLQKIIEVGVAGRDDKIPADGVDWQRRAVSDAQYPAAHGMRSRSASDGSPGGLVPDKTGWNPAVQVRQPKR